MGDFLVALSYLVPPVFLVADDPILLINLGSVDHLMYDGMSLQAFSRFTGEDRPDLAAMLLPIILDLAMLTLFLSLFELLLLLDIVSSWIVSMFDPTM